MRSPAQTALSPETALLAALAADPGIEDAASALKAANDRFSAIRAKLDDASIEADANKREADARAALVRAQALSEIGSATPGDVAAARSEMQSATEALQGIAGRDVVLVEELRKAQVDVGDKHAVVADLLAKWRSNASAASAAAAAEGLRLIRLAALANHSFGNSYGGVPEHSGDVGDWLAVNHTPMPAQSAPEVSRSAEKALNLLRRADDFANQEIRAPRRATSVPQQEQHIAPTFRAPGIPHSLTHDPLGSPLPEAKSELERQRKRAAAPYDDGRGDAEEVA